MFFLEIFDKKYFNLPDFILETIITEKQDNFCFKDNKGNLTNAFAFVSNKEKSKKKYAFEGNKNVLRARFADANFFIQEDLKKLNQVKELKNFPQWFFTITWEPFMTEHKE